MERCIESHDWRRYQLPSVEREDDVVGAFDRCSIRNVMSVCVGAIGLDLDLDEGTDRAANSCISIQ